MDFDSINYFSKQFSTIFFFIFFMMIVYYAYRKGNKEELESIKYSIFDEEEMRRIP